MSRFVAMHCGPETEALLSMHPKSFLLLCQIAMRARWKDCHISGRQQGEAFIGDYKATGIGSEMAYRHAKKTLVRLGLARFKGTNKGTVATLANNSIFSISALDSNRPATGQQRTKSEPTTTNHKDTQIHGHTEEKESPSFSLQSPSDTEPTAEAIYSEYPRKVGKADALRAIGRALKTRAPAFLMERTRAYAEAVRWQEKQFASSAEFVC